MRLLPYRYRPSFIIRRRAIRYGLRGGNLFWRAVAIWIYGRGPLRNFFGRNDEPIAIERVVIGQFLKISVTAPATGLGRRRYRKELARVRAQAHADVEAARTAS